MGYNTDFKGKLVFVNELTIPQLKKLQSILGEDCRNHKEWTVPSLTYIDLQLTEDYDGIEWNGSEKTYDLALKINVVINEMRKKFPDFALHGTIKAQGEKFEDRYTIFIDRDRDGLAYVKPLVVTGVVVKCPHCDEKFELEG